MITRLTGFLTSARASLLVYVISRVALVAVYVCLEHRVIADVHYYQSSLDHMGRRGVDNTLREYPVPAVALLWIPAALVRALGQPDWYGAVCVLFLLITDAAFMLALISQRDPSRSGRNAIPAAEWAWILALPALGSTPLARFDLAPGVLVGLALLFVTRHPRLSGATLAVAAWIKYWPAIVIPGVLSSARRASHVLAGTAATGALIAVACLASSSIGRLLSPLSYQDTRGLQVESIVATPLMLARALSGAGSRWAVWDAASKSFEIRGPGAGVLETFSVVLSVASLVVLGMLWARAWRTRADREPAQSATILVWITLSAILLFIVSSKVFSPQYLLWVLPASAVAVVLSDDVTRRRRLRWMAGLLAAAALTQVVYPVGYTAIETVNRWTGLITATLACRDLIVVALAVTAVVEALRATRPRQLTVPRPGLMPSVAYEH